MTNDIDIARDIDAIEQAFVSHWRVFGLYPGASQYDEDGVLWNESPIAHLPYNAVLRSNMRGDAERIVARICARFRSRHVPFMWVIRPTDQPENLPHLLAQQGLDKVEEATGMVAEIRSVVLPQLPTRAIIVEADTDDRHLIDYEELIRTYWSVPEHHRDMLRTLNRYWLGERNPGVRLVAYLDGTAIGKLFLNLSEVPNMASVYGVTVLPQARGLGIATAMMQTAMSRARDAGTTRMVLHSSSMAKGMYERLGFVPRCTFAVYATGPLFGTHHH